MHIGSLVCMQPIARALVITNLDSNNTIIYKLYISVLYIQLQYVRKCDSIIIRILIIKRQFKKL